MDTLTIAATLLFFTELYHILGHSVILFGIRQVMMNIWSFWAFSAFCLSFGLKSSIPNRSLPYRDLERIGYYFAIDLVTVALSWCLTQEFTILVAFQQVQHIYYVLNWNKSDMAKRGNPFLMVSKLYIFQSHSGAHLTGTSKGASRGGSSGLAPPMIYLSTVWWHLHCSHMRWAFS